MLLIGVIFRKALSPQPGWDHLRYPYNYPPSLPALCAGRREDASEGAILVVWMKCIFIWWGRGLGYLAVLGDWTSQARQRGVGGRAEEPVTDFTL